MEEDPAEEQHLALAKCQQIADSIRTGARGHGLGAEVDVVKLEQVLPHGNERDYGLRYPTWASAICSNACK